MRGLTQLLYALQALAARRRLGAFRAVVARSGERRCRQRGLERHPGEGDGALQQPLQRSLDAGNAEGGDRTALAAAAHDPALSRKAADRWRLLPRPPSSDVFLTRDDALIRSCPTRSKSHRRRPALSTSGGTSDARFIKDYCPVVEFGPVGTSMHQIDEHIPLAEIERRPRSTRRLSTRIFAR